MISVNNKILVKPYSGELKIKTDNSGGFSKIIQKQTLVGLEILRDGEIIMAGSNTALPVKKGQVAYFQEEVLATQRWAKMEFNVEGEKEVFAIVDGSFVVAVK